MAVSQWSVVSCQLSVVKWFAVSPALGVNRNSRRGDCPPLLTEKQARIILAQAEVEIANMFDTASESYKDNPTALHLRAMNMLYEGLKEKGALMLVPSTAVESMGMGGLIGAAALRQKSLTGSEETPE